MTPELKAKWIAALESGKYPKTEKHLRTCGGFCCLGVLLDIEGHSWLRIDEDGAYFEPREAELHSGEELSDEAKQDFGLLDADHDQLVKINDESMTFEPVVRYIKEHL